MVEFVQARAETTNIVHTRARGDLSFCGLTLTHGHVVSKERLAGVDPWLKLCASCHSRDGSLPLIVEVDASTCTMVWLNRMKRRTRLSDGPTRPLWIRVTEPDKCSLYRTPSRCDAVWFEEIYPTVNPDYYLQHLSDAVR